MLRFEGLPLGSTRCEPPVLGRTATGGGCEGPEEPGECCIKLIHPRCGKGGGVGARSPGFILGNVERGGRGGKTRDPFLIGDLFAPKEMDESGSVAGKSVFKTSGAMNNGRLGVRGRPEVVNMPHCASIAREKGGPNRKVNPPRKMEFEGSG